MRTLRALGAGLGAVFASALAASPAGASDGFALNRFEPAERGSQWFVLDTLDIQGRGRPALGLTLDYQHRPLVVYGPGGAVESAIVGHVVTTHVGANVTLWDRVRVGASLPVVLYGEGERGRFGGVTYDPPAEGTAVGDLRFAADVRLFGAASSPMTMALGGRLWTPTGSPTSYTGDGGVRGGPRLSAAGAVGLVAYAATLGVAFRDPKVSSFANIPVEHELVYGASAGLRLREGKIVVGPELFGTTSLANASFRTRSSPVEILLGGHFAIAGGLRVGVGVGTGLVGGAGAPAVRALGSFEWTPDAVRDADGDGVIDADDACPNDKGVRSADPAKSGCPSTDGDTDGDGIGDAEDACMDVFGKKTSDPRTNGCADRDADGVFDPLDACPDEAGPAASDPKKNGCPEVRADRDKDGVPDFLDACPDVVGNPSSDPERSGCPDPDPDNDGIPTGEDACPDVAGKADPDPTKNGCPAAFIQGSQIRIKDQVKFKTASAEIEPGKDSEEILRAVLEILKTHPEIKRVRVEGHTDSRGNPAQNKSLSQARAAAVVKWLATSGIERSRLSSAGFGDTRPLDANDSERGRAMNRRVELHIETQ